MIPSQIKYDANATPPQFTDNEDYRIEPGTHIRVKIMGTRSEVGEMWAIGTINEDYLGYVLTGSCWIRCSRRILTLQTPRAMSWDFCLASLVYHARLRPTRDYP